MRSTKRFATLALTGLIAVLGACGPAAHEIEDAAGETNISIEVAERVYANEHENQREDDRRRVTSEMQKLDLRDITRDEARDGYRVWRALATIEACGTAAAANEYPAHLDHETVANLCQKDCSAELLTRYHRLNVDQRVDACTRGIGPDRVKEFDTRFSVYELEIMHEVPSEYANALPERSAHSIGNLWRKNIPALFAGDFGEDVKTGQIYALYDMEETNDSASLYHDSFTMNSKIRFMEEEIAPEKVERYGELIARFGVCLQAGSVLDHMHNKDASFQTLSEEAERFYAQRLMGIGNRVYCR